MTHMLEGQLNGVVEETEKERALKEVFEALCGTKLQHWWLPKGELRKPKGPVQLPRKGRQT